MEAYKNRGGDSNVAAYEIGDDWIKVRFRDGSLYTYTYQSAGRDTIERMKTLAVDGHGLNSYITRFVRKRYASRG